MNALNFNNNERTTDEHYDALSFYHSLQSGLNDLDGLTEDQINELIDNMQF